MTKNIAKMVIDITLFISLISLCLFGEFTNINHEILGISFGLLFIIHIIINRKTLFKCSNNYKRIITFILNLLTGISIFTCVISGILISEIFSTFNLGLVWINDLHYYSFIAMIILTILHLINHLNYYSYIFKQPDKNNNLIIILSTISSLIIVAIMLTLGEVISSNLSVEDNLDNQYVNENSSDNISNENTESEDNSLTVFNSETLAVYNGKNGMPAYIAVDGIVYDASNLFRNGTHHGCSAGKDITSEFNHEHPSRYLDKLTIVGTYED